MLPYTYGRKDGSHLIDVVRTHCLLERACHYLFAAAKRGKSFIFIGTKASVSEVLKKEADRCGQFYVRDLWLPGTISNWGSISCLVSRLLYLRIFVGTDAFLKVLGKRERASFQREKDLLESCLSGVVRMTRRPDIAIVVDPEYDKYAVDECRSLGIEVISLMSTDCDPGKVDIPIPGNDYLHTSAGLILRFLSESINKGGGNELRRPFGLQGW